jgi:hypothetical protein
MYRDGQGVKQDYAEAAGWFRKAADQGDASAQFAIGTMCFKGQGVPPDYAEAIKWYRNSAEQGNSKAQYNLGFMYYNGQGVPRDDVQSYFWFSLAASRSAAEDHDKFSGARDVAAKRLIPEKLKEAQRKKREWEKSHPR